MTLREWIKQFQGQFDNRDLEYMTVQKADLVAQLKDAETGNIHLHRLEYKAKDAAKIIVVEDL